MPDAGRQSLRRLSDKECRNCSVSTDGGCLLTLGEGPSFCLVDGAIDTGAIESITVAGGHESVLVGVVPADSVPSSFNDPGLFALQLSGRLLAGGVVSEVSPAQGRPAGGTVEDVTLSCDVSSSSNTDRCRRALHGVEHYWESRGDTPSPLNPHWLQVALPPGLELRRLVLHCRKFDSYSPKTVRLRVGSVAEPQAMTMVVETDLDDREYRTTIVDEVQLSDLDEAPRFIRLEVIENRGINCKVAGIQIFAGHSGFRGSCTVTATCNLLASCPRLSFDAGKGIRSSVPLLPSVTSWRFFIAAEARGATARLLSRPGSVLIQRLQRAEAVLEAFGKASPDQLKPADLPSTFLQDLFAEWWVQPGGGADDEREASKPKPWLKAEPGELCCFGAGVAGCNGMFRPVEYDDGGSVVLFMNDHGAIMFRVEEGWRMNSEFSVSEFDYSAGVDAAGVWTPQVPAKGPAPTVCGPAGPAAKDLSKRDESPSDAWGVLSSRLAVSRSLQDSDKLLAVPGAQSISLRVDAAVPCGWAVAISQDLEGKALLGTLSSPMDHLDLPTWHCYAHGLVPRPAVWSLEERVGQVSPALWTIEGNPGKQHLSLENGGRVVTYKKGAPDFCTILGQAPVTSGVHLFEFVTHKIGDELWLGVTDDPSLAGPRTNLRIHRNAYTYYCGRRRSGNNHLRDGQASLHNSGKAEVRFEQVADGDVVGLLINADRRRAVFYRNGVLQGECVLPAKPLWLVAQLDAPEDRVELRRGAVGLDMESLVGSALPSEAAARGEGALHSTLLLSPSRESEMTEHFTVQALFRPLAATLPPSASAFCGPAICIVSCDADGEAAGSQHLEIGVDLTRHESQPKSGGAPWLLGQGPRTGSSSKVDAAKLDTGRTVEDGPLVAGDTVAAIAVSGDGAKLSAVVLLKNGKLAAWWDLGPEAPFVPAELRMCVRVRGVKVQLKLMEPVKGQVEALPDFAAGGFAPEQWSELLRFRTAPPEELAVTVTAQPKLLLPSGKMRIAEEHLGEAWAEFCRLGFHNWSREDDDRLMSLLQRVAEGNSGQPLNLAQIRGMLGDSGRLGVHDPRGVHVRYNLLRGLSNLITADVLPFADLRRLRFARHGRLLLACRRFLLPELRDAFLREALEKGCGGSNGEEALHLDRQQALQCREDGACDTAGEVMIFSQAARQSIRWHVKVLRSKAPPFRVRYRDEPGQDSGGVYRDFLDTVADELMSPQLPVLIPTPNQVAESGENRNEFLLNPSLEVGPGSPGRRMLHFLGQLMGVCLRRGDILPLCLSRVVWKGILGEEVGLQDLESFDQASASSIRQLREISEEQFHGLGELRFVARDSANRERELKENGRNTAVTPDQVQLFAQLQMEMRLSESKRQLELLKTGLATVVPLDCLALWSWQFLEERVCGIAEIDVELLRKYTRYDGISPEAREVGFLWEILREMSQEDLCCFLHFVWGRSRLPPDGSPKWQEGFKICGQAVGPDRDNWLPTAHTCFFQLDLPAYTSKDACRERILFAIHNTVSLGIA